MPESNINFTNFELSIKLKSDTLIGSGHGYGVLIDSDVVFDDNSIPYIPAKRIKGLLKDSAREIMGSALGKDFSGDLMDQIFGKKGESTSKSSFHDLHIENYAELKPWLNYLMNEKSFRIFTPEAVKSCFTVTRSQTAIGDKPDEPGFGTAKKNSLRTIRVLNRALCFKGLISLSSDVAPELLEYAAQNLKWLGTKRNRGFGNVDCSLTKMEAKNV